jgi:Ca2+-binding RTX toxin-like protein
MSFIEVKPITYGTAGRDVINGTNPVTPGLAYSTADGASLGLAGNDSITGSPFNDTLVEGADNDTLRGAAGSDQLYGGRGSDHFKYGHNSGNEISNPNAADWFSSNGDRIMDFQGAGGWTSNDNDSLDFIGFGGAGVKLEFMGNWTSGANHLDYVQFYKVTAGTHAGFDAGKWYWLAITAVDANDHTITKTVAEGAPMLVSGRYGSDYLFA